MTGSASPEGGRFTIKPITVSVSLALQENTASTGGTSGWSDGNNSCIYNGAAQYPVAIVTDSVSGQKWKATTTDGTTTTVV